MAALFQVFSFLQFLKLFPGPHHKNKIFDPTGFQRMLFKNLFEIPRESHVCELYGPRGSGKSSAIAIAAVILSILKETKHKIIELLKIESIINTPITVLLPFIMLDFIQSVDVQVSLQTLSTQIVPFLQQIVTGIGAGLLVGLIIFKLMRKAYSERYSPIAIIVAALLTYLLAEK